MAQKKFIIEKEKGVWYSDSDAQNTSDLFFESYIFSKDEVITALKNDIKILRIIHLTCESLSPYITDTVTLLHEDLWKPNDTMGQFIGKVRTFIQSDSVIDVENLIREDYKSLESLVDDCAKVVTEKYKKYLSKTTH